MEQTSLSLPAKPLTSSNFNNNISLRVYEKISNVSVIVEIDVKVDVFADCSWPLSQGTWNSWNMSSQLIMNPTTRRRCTWHQRCVMAADVWIRCTRNKNARHVRRWIGISLNMMLGCRGTGRGTCSINKKHDSHLSSAHVRLRRENHSWENECIKQKHVLYKQSSMWSSLIQTTCNFQRSPIPSRVTLGCTQMSFASEIHSKASCWCLWSPCCSLALALAVSMWIFCQVWKWNLQFRESSQKVWAPLSCKVLTESWLENNLTMVLQTRLR